jgi:uroporphyrinogen decarboxylase
MEVGKMLKDEMNPIERRQAIAAGKPFDRIPFVLCLGETASHLIGTTISKYHHSAQLMAEAEIVAYRMFGQDGVGFGPGCQGLAEALGTKLEYPENHTSYVKEPAIKDWSDLEHLEPADPKKAGKMPLHIETLKILKDKLGKEVPVGTIICGAFSIAAYMRGTDNLLRDLYKNPEKVHRLMELITDSALLYIDEVIDLGCNISLGDPVASGSLINAAHFREFAKPYLTQLADRVRERTGFGPMLHICGDTKRIWRDMVETGAATLSLDNVIDLGEAKNQVGNEVCLMGNVDPVSVVANGTQEEIRNAVRHCLIQACDSPKGYILAPGCQIPLGTPTENIQCFANAARTLGRYPIDKDKLKEK